MFPKLLSLRSKPLKKYRPDCFNQPCITPLGGHGPRGVCSRNFCRFAPNRLKSIDLATLTSPASRRSAGTGLAAYIPETFVASLQTA